MLTDLDEPVWLPTGTDCSQPNGSVLVVTPSPVSVCIDPVKMPAGSHYLFFVASTQNVTRAYGALPLKVTPAGSVSVNPANISLSTDNPTRLLAITVSGTNTIRNVIGNNAQTGVGNWLSTSTDCSGLASCQTTVIATAANLASPTPGTTYLGRLTVTATDGSVADILVQFQYQPSGTSQISITSPSTFNGLMNESFNVTLSASGGTPPFIWSATGLPPGLNMSSGGVISGSVSAAGTPQATVTVTDALGGTQSQTVTFNFQTQANAIPMQVFPHIAADASGWQTDLLIQNTSAVPVSFTLRFHTDTGAQIAIETVGSVDHISATVPAHGTAFYRTAATVTSDGWAEVDSAVPLSGVAIFRLHAADGNYYEASDSLTAPANGFTMPFDSSAFAGTSGYATGLAITNADPAQKAQLTCTAYNSAGATIASNLQLPLLNASGHTAFLLEQNATLKAAVAGTRGQLVCTANTEVSAIALRALNYSVSSMPVTVNE